MTPGRGVVIAGGGTGGHVVPSLQIARALVARGHEPAHIELYGSRRGHEAALWPTLEFHYTLLPGRGIRRSMRPAAVWANLGAVLGLTWASLRAVASFARRRPSVVVVVGGYASFAAAVAAFLTRVPLVLVHIDAVPGAVSGLFVRVAAANAVAFENMGLPRSVVTGTPVQPELGAAAAGAGSQRDARRALGLPTERMTVAVTGGSLGALRINAAVKDLASRWATRGDVSLYHVTGRRDFADFELSEGQRPAPDDGVCYLVVPFEDRMPDFYRAADLCICRAGAMTVAELLVTGVPAILVPLPGAPRDHQTRNAQALVSAGAAVMVPDGECDGDRLAKEVDALLSDVVRLDAMRAAGSRLGRPDAAARLAEVVDAHAR